jgi:hypothetical protein
MINNYEEKEEAPEGGYRPLNGFPTPADFLTYFDDDINSGRVTLYPWQVEELEMFGNVEATGLKPFKHALCAANGSGKDAFIVAPFAMWFICCKKKSIVLITSSSGVQLTNQTEKYLVQFAKKVNAFAEKEFGKAIIKIRQRRITCTLTGSEIFLFATDEGSKAEGYHPAEPGAEMAIIVNEAKSVTPEIFGALRRCTGFNYWIDVSSPGEPFGDFHTHFDKWPSRRRVTFYDCLGHQSRSEFEEDKRVLGEHDPLFRSKWLAEFTAVGGKHVIDSVKLEKLRSLIKGFYIKQIALDDNIRIGLDIALSEMGDESTISAFHGNKQIKLSYTRIQDATILADWFDKEMRSLGVKREHSYIFADDGGVGRAVIDILKRMGWINIKRVLNQSKPRDGKNYRNRGAELWYKFKKLVEHQAVILLDDDRLYQQISSRKFKDTDQGVDKITLESKKTMIASGLPSPDRADSVVLCFTDVDLERFLDKFNQVTDAAPKLTREEYIRKLAAEITMARTNLQTNNSGRKAHGSLNSILHGNRKQNDQLGKWFK